MEPARAWLHILQQQMPTLKTQPMSWSSLDGLVHGIFQLLSQHEIHATIWSKLPASWQGERAIEGYHQSGLADRIYRCQQAEPASLSSWVTQVPPAEKAIAPNVVPLLLETNSLLQCEYFILVLSPQVSFLLFAQELSEQEPANRASVPKKRLSLEGFFSFSPILIEAMLNLIKQSLPLTDSTPEALLLGSEPSFPLPTSVGVNILSDLLQLPWPERQPQALASPPIASVAASPPSGILLTPEFLKQLTRELSLPLTNIKTALRLLDSMHHKREQRQRYLTLLQGECDRQNALLSSLQELVELNQIVEEGDLALNLEDFVPGIVSIYQPLASEKGINLGYTVAVGLPPVACYRQWLQQILRHLLQNSIKFTPAKGRVYVQVDRQQDRIVLMVTDTGVGIESRDIPHLFEPFFRGRNLSPEEIAGAGLGLMVVKQLIDRCHGTIKINSQPHKGTRIILTLPIVYS